MARQKSKTIHPSKRACSHDCHSTPPANLQDTKIQQHKPTRAARKGFPLPQLVIKCHHCCTPPNRTNSVDGSRRGTIAEKGRKKEKGKATPPQKCRERRWGGEAFGHPCTRTHARTRRATLKPPCAVIVTANVPVVTRSRPLFPSQSHRSQSLSLRASTPFR